jgi:hypothetical protein
MYLNDYDLQCARSEFTRATAPNLLALVMVVDNLREWADDNSDGWAYWAKPRNAASTAVDYIVEGQRRIRASYGEGAVDCSDADVTRCVAPIKAFLTRQKVSAERREVILRSVTA